MNTGAAAFSAATYICIVCDSGETSMAIVILRREVATMAGEFRFSRMLNFSTDLAI
jgi:hypothetical protein